MGLDCSSQLYGEVDMRFDSSMATLGTAWCCSGVRLAKQTSGDNQRT